MFLYSRNNSSHFFLINLREILTFYNHTRFNFISAILVFYLLPCLHHTQYLCKVLLYRCKVHLVKTYEERYIGVHLRLDKELYKLLKLISLAQIAVVTKQLCRVMPVRLHLYHAVVAWSCSIFVLQILWA